MIVSSLNNICFIYTNLTANKIIILNEGILREKSGDSFDLAVDLEGQDLIKVLDLSRLLGLRFMLWLLSKQCRL